MARPPVARSPAYPPPVRGRTWAKLATTGSGYLALGDSVAFGYRESATSPPPDYSDAADFVGYPEDIGSALHLDVTNASCPGETSASFVNTANPSYGCEGPQPGGVAGYRQVYPLHVAYKGSQLAFAVHFLTTHHDTRLVTLGIGANDAFLCEATTSDKCASELPSVLARIEANVATILHAIRDQARYHGQLVVVDYYSLDYADATDNESSQALNQAMATAGAKYHVEIADEYTAFENAAQYSDQDSCTAGLLTQLTTGGCGVHPSVSGQDVLAQTIESTVHQGR
jgi:lysophospholipase L1-like esterase